jgi:hypothetical protein
MAHCTIVVSTKANHVQYCMVITILCTVHARASLIRVFNLDGKICRIPQPGYAQLVQICIAGILRKMWRNRDSIFIVLDSSPAV